MNMWEAFLANLLANLAVAFPVLAVYLWATRTFQQWRLLIRRFGTCVSLRARFMCLILTRKRRRSDFHTLSMAERTRVFLLNLVAGVPQARLIAIRQMSRNFRDLGKIVDDIHQVSSIPLLVDTLGSMSMQDIEESIECNPDALSPEERTKWLVSQPSRELARWLLRLNEHDRRAWQSWLVDSDSLTIFEAVLFPKDV